jgi:hypothetical protein
VRDVIDYAIVLLVKENEQAKTVRVYDGAHGVNEMHRYTRRAASRQPRSFTVVLSEKECALRLERSSVAADQLSKHGVSDECREP